MHCRMVGRMRRVLGLLIIFAVFAVARMLLFGVHAARAIYVKVAPQRFGIINESVSAL